MRFVAFPNDFIAEVLMTEDGVQRHIIAEGFDLGEQLNLLRRL